LTEDVKQKVSELGEVKYIAALDAEVRIEAPQNMATVSNIRDSTTFS
jgi:hypothetical protein